MLNRFKVAFSDAIRSLRRLVLEVTGFFFLALGVVGIGSVVTEYRRYGGWAASGIWRLLASGVFTGATLAFGIHTLWKSRKIK